jgi:hypothetical protein
MSGATTLKVTSPSPATMRGDQLVRGRLGAFMMPRQAPGERAAHGCITEKAACVVAFPDPHLALRAYRSRRNPHEGNRMIPSGIGGAC